jgi:1,4-dihydroxy-6-naphthoate synthase
MDISLGISPCPNDVFIFSGIILEKVPTEGLRFSVVYDDVETLNGQSQSGDLDLVKISYANYLRCEAHYDLLDCGGALGYGCGPLLLANGDRWDPNREILSPGEFTTANFLLDFFAQQPLTKRFLPFDALYEELCRTPGVQGVVIHEKRFTYQQDGLTLIKDLGSYWEEQTGYAIPLGAIAIRRSLDRKQQMEEIVRRSLRWAANHYDEAFQLCREHAQDLTPSTIRAHIELYVNRFSEDVGAEGRATVAYFLEQQRRFAVG